MIVDTARLMLSVLIDDWSGRLGITNELAQ